MASTSHCRAGDQKRQFVGAGLGRRALGDRGTFAGTAVAKDLVAHRRVAACPGRCLTTLTHQSIIKTTKSESEDRVSPPDEYSVRSIFPPLEPNGQQAIPEGNSLHFRLFLPTKARTATPSPISAQVPGSGTGETTTAAAATSANADVAKTLADIAARAPINFD